MFSFQFDPKVHLIRRTPISGWLEREFPRFQMFTYFHAQKKVWVVSLWLRNKYGMMEDELVLGPEPTMTPEAAAYLKYLMNGPAVDPCKAIRQHEKYQIDSTIEDTREETELRRDLARMTGAPDPLNSQKIQREV